MGVDTFGYYKDISSSILNTSLTEMVVSEINMNEEEQSQQTMIRPEKFRPDWPPRPSQKAVPSVFARCSNQFKKVTWPPKDGDENVHNDDPLSSVQLKDEIPLNDEAFRPTGTYKAAPTIYAEQPAPLSEEVWPPPESIDTSEKVIHDATRPKRVIRDYTVFFNKNAAQPTQPSYKVPPGTLHVISQRGVLSYDTPDLGAAARMAPEDIKF